MIKKLSILLAAAGVLMLGAAALFLSGVLAPPEPRLVKVGAVPEGTIEPRDWGNVYPQEYESWARTWEPRPAGKSAYKRGWDTDNILWDKLSEFPFMALLFQGFGFSTEYNEPRGHHYMRIDQDIIDPVRTKSGGVCLNCKTPYMDSLVRAHGKGFYSMPWQEAISKIPAQHKDLGATCYDCHDSRTMDIRTNRGAFTAGLAKLGKKEFTRQEKRILACAQCHNTYNIPKDEAGKPVGLEHPWKGSEWGNISVENIIRDIKSEPSWREWTHRVTGIKLAFLRHPEFEFFTRQSVHFKAGLSCADCHMPYRRSGSVKISDHNVMSPLKDDCFACGKCHPDQAAPLRDQVVEIQKSTLSLINRAGYACAAAAKLFETANSARAAGKTLNAARIAKAEDFYIEAIYRTIYMGAENSVGFHNPAEAGRILGDAVAFAGRAEALLRQELAGAGTNVPDEVPLRLGKYLNNRGERNLGFKAEQELADPFPEGPGPVIIRK
jgi:nitrite reductase (cytochrome c-552)